MHILGILGVLAQTTAPAAPAAAPAAAAPLAATAAAPAAAAAASTAVMGAPSLLDLIIHAHWVVQLTLALLVFFSIVSWAIIGSKQRQLKRAKSRSDKFYQMFWQTKSLESMKGKFQKSPAFNIFRTAIESLRENPNVQSSPLVEREIKRATEEEVAQMEYGVPFLATTGSAAPFIGLFGTVFGILNAFWKIGQTGASSMAVVGPHIAEALIATAIGLAAAIPAVIFYNMFVAKIRVVSKDLFDFSEELCARINREYYNVVT